MSDFDIANLHGRTSFAASLQKRKMLGLDSDSEEDDEMPHKQKLSKRDIPSSSNTPKKNNNSATNEAEQATTIDLDIPNDENSDNDTSTPTPTPPPTTTTTTTTTTTEPVVEVDPFHRELQESLSTTEQYLAAAEALMAQPMPKAYRLKRTHSNNSSNNNAGSSNLESESNSGSFIELSDTEDLDEYTPLIPDAEIEDLDPVLAALLAENADSGTKRQAQKVLIKLQYIHNLPSTSDKVKELLIKLLKPMKIYIMDTDQFQKVLDAFANHKKLKRDELVLTFNNNYVYPQTTPAGIGMSDIGVNYMNVYSRTSYEKMKEDKEKKRQERLMKYTQDEDSFVKEETNTNGTAATSNIENIEETEQKIMLKLRGKDNKDIAMRAKYTTPLESLLQHYKQITGNNANLKLSLDGEILDLKQTVQDVDLEDEDIIEVV